MSHAKTPPRGAVDIVEFIKSAITRNEHDEPFVLQPFQEEILRTAFRFDGQGKLAWDSLLRSMPKESGKTTLNAVILAAWGFTQEPNNTILISANDLEQAQARVFTTLAGLIRHNALLREHAEIQSRVIKLSNGTVYLVITSDSAGEAGANQGCSSSDEPWGVTTEAGRRLSEELTPVPTRRNSIRVITSYAGFVNESRLLWDLYLRGVGPEEHPDGQGVKIHPSLPLYLNREARQLTLWDHTPRMSWQTPEYYAAQRRTLRPNTYLRLHENRWVTAESTFISEDQLRACRDLTWHPPTADAELSVFVGADAALRHDCLAVVTVAWVGGKLRVIAHRIWAPTPGQTLDLEVLERYILDLRGRFSVRQVVCDPWQLARSIAVLKAQGVRAKELPQTEGNTAKMGQVLYDLVNEQQLVLYTAADLETHLLNAAVVETGKGFRLTKATGSRKIDGAVALAMAAVAASEAPLWARNPGTIGATTAPTETVGESMERFAEQRKRWQAEAIEEDVKRQGWWFPSD